jgi:glycosyltransferase involved in cell wall biosynthesis
MRILYSHRINSRDGQGVHVDELVAAFRAEGHEVLIVGPAAYHSTSFGGESSSFARWRRLLPGALGEAAELGYAGPAALRLLRACRAFQPDLIYERYNLFHLAGTALAGRQRAPVFLEVNAPLAEERRKFAGLRMARLARAVERTTWRAASRVLPVTGVLAEIVREAGVPAERITVIPNAIVAERFAAPSRPERPDPVVLGFVGFVRAWHGLDHIVAAMAADAGFNLSLCVVGDGPARPGLEEQAARLGIAAKVDFTGVVPNAEVPRLVAGFDIALQPAVTAYASPLKIFDYMAAGCAIVAPDQPNIREILEDGTNALLFPPGQPDAVWGAVQRLAADAALRRRLGAAARAAALEKHTWRGNARRIVALAEAAA